MVTVHQPLVYNRCEYWYISQVSVLREVYTDVFRIVLFLQAPCREQSVTAYGYRVYRYMPPKQYAAALRSWEVKYAVLTALFHARAAQDAVLASLSY